MAVGGVLLLASGIVWAVTSPDQTGPYFVGPIWVWLWAVSLLVSAASYIYTTRRGKLLVWLELAAGFALRGDERVLDLGCGRGLVLLAVAGHLTSGHAIGVDLWRGRDQSGNNEQATWDNATAEGVRDRIELCTADLRHLPLASGSVDLVVSALAIHNIGDAAGRLRAIDEAARVLRPGGRIAIADIGHTGAYRRRLTELGLTATCRSLGPRYWYGGPHVAAKLVTATKPPNE